MRSTGCDFNTLLRQALVEALWADWGEVLDREGDLPAHSVSYCRRKARMLSNPAAYVRRHKRPAWRKAMAGAACVLLALILVLGLILWTHPDALKWPRHTTQVWLGEEFSPQPPNPSPSAALGRWQLSYLPIGYVQTMAFSSGQTRIMIYENALRRQIRFEYRPSQEINCVSKTDSLIHTEAVWVDHCLGILFRSASAPSITHMVWTDPSLGASFHLAGDVSRSELIKMSENVYLKENT